MVVKPEVWEDCSVVDIIFDTDVNSGASDTFNVWDGDAVTVLLVEPIVREDVRVDDIPLDVNSGVSDTLNVWDVVVEPEVKEDVRVDDIILDADVMSGILELLPVWDGDAVIDVEWDPVELSTNSWSWSIVSSRSSFVSRRESFKELKALRSTVVHESTVLLSICDANISIVDTWDMSLDMESNVVTKATNSEQDKMFIPLWFKTSLIWFVTFSIEDVILSRFSILVIIWDWLIVVETEFVGCELELVDLKLVLLPVEVVEWEIAMGFSGDLVGLTVEECVKPTHCKYCNIFKLLCSWIFMKESYQTNLLRILKRILCLVMNFGLMKNLKKD